MTEKSLAAIVEGAGPLAAGTRYGYPSHRRNVARRRDCVCRRHQRPSRECVCGGEFIMDYLKTKAPFWKREATPEGERWVESRDSDKHAASRW